MTSDAEINVLSFESAGNGLYYIKGYNGNYVGCGLPNSLVSTSEQNSSYSYTWQITVNSSGEATIYNAVNDRYLKYRSYVSGFKVFASSQSDAFNAKLYSHAGVAPTVEAPTFSPDGGMFTGSAVVTITSATEGATIYYTTDDTDPVVNSRATNTIANGGSVTLTESCTLKALAAKDGMAPSAIVSSQSFTINQAGGSGDFMLVTDASTLNAGDEIIFVSATSGSAYAMGDQSTNNRPGVSVTVNSGPSVSDADDIETFTLEGGTGAWYFKANKLTSGYLYAASSGSNYLRTEETADNNAKATISIDSNVASITFQGTNTRNQLKYNSQNHIFSCYASGQQPVYIYRRTTTPKVETPVFSPAPENGPFTSAQSVTISCETPGAAISYRISTDNGTTWSSWTPWTDGTPLIVSQTTMIEAKATLADYDDSDVAEATYTIDLSPTLTVEPNVVNINDPDNATRTGTFTVTWA